VTCKQGLHPVHYDSEALTATQRQGQSPTCRLLSSTVQARVLSEDPVPSASLLPGPAAACQRLLRLSSILSLTSTTPALDVHRLMTRIRPTATELRLGLGSCRCCTVRVGATTRWQSSSPPSQVCEVLPLCLQACLSAAMGLCLSHGAPP
jgi:hypothetical protein